jgi:hypothetical protein
MKAISKLLVAGMLAMGPTLPLVQAKTQTYTATKVTITDALAYRILAEVRSELEAQLNQSLSTDFLYNAYKSGHAKITYLGQNADGYHLYSVEYLDGLGIADLVEAG